MYERFCMVIGLVLVTCTMIIFTTSNGSVSTVPLRENVAQVIDTRIDLGTEVDNHQDRIYATTGQCREAAKQREVFYKGKYPNAISVASICIPE